MPNSLFLIPIFVIFVILAGLFAGAETGMYRLSRLRLRLGIEKKKFSFRILGRVMHDSSGLLLSMLTGTNLAHYVAASITTYLFLNKVTSEHAAELFATFVTAPILFVFSELIPKNIFFYRADRLMPRFATFLFVSHKLFNFCGVVPLLKFIAGLFAKLIHSASSPKTVITTVQRHQVKAIIQDTHEEGILSSVQADIVNRIVSIPGIQIKSVMVPLGKVQMADVNSDAPGLLNILQKSPFTRLPVYDRWPANIIGFINIYETLSSTQHFSDLRAFIKPIRKLHADTTVTDAINIMQKEKQKIVLVTRTGYAGGERPIGIVTMKDLVEELLGELAEW